MCIRDRGFELGLIDFLRRDQDHARQRVLRQFLERLAQAGELLELFQRLLTADPLGIGHIIHRDVYKRQMLIWSPR